MTLGPIATGVSRSPCTYTEAPNGLIYIANGIDPWLRWDGLSLAAETAGVIAPIQAPTIASGTNPGDIVGTYNAYLRFVDQYGYVSDLSPLSNTLDPVSSTSGVITDASNATPIVITSAGHGLATGAVIKVDGVGGNVSANNTWSITVVDANTFSLDGSAGTTTYSGGGTWIAGADSIVYTNVAVPTEPKVVRRQLLRNLDAEFQTYYVDVDTTDLVSTSFTSTNDDTFLAAGEAVPILNPDGSPFANAHGIPPNWKAATAFHLGRMFAAVEVPIDEGSIAVTLGSPTVQGIGTHWTASLAGRALYVNNATKAFQIQSVNAATQTITLLTNYTGSTNPYASYVIRPEPAERRLVYYSEAGQPDSIPASNALEVQENGDDLTGVMVMSSFVYFLEKHHIHRFTFQTDPAIDGYVFQASASRGCINRHCWVVVDDSAFMLDEQGVHVFEGGQTQPLSQPIQDIFRRGDGNYEINWAASKNFHAAHYPSQETVRWFVCLSGHYLPRHALTFNYRLNRWWVEQYPQPVGASQAMQINGLTTLYLGTTANRILAYWTNLLDGPDASAGSLQGTCTSSTLLSLSDGAASFAASGLVGAPLTITDGTGKGQTRLITSVTGQTVNVDDPWMTLPDATSSYQIGGINYFWRSGWFRFQDNPPDELLHGRIEVDYERCNEPATLSLRQTIDYFGNVTLWDLDVASVDGDGVRIQADNPDLVVDLTKPEGFIQKRLDRRRDTYAEGAHWTFWDVFGTTNEDPVTIYQIILDGVTPP